MLFFQTNHDEEEDIFSKNSRELQIKRQDSTGVNVTIVKHEISNDVEGNNSEAAGSSSNQPKTRNWETFEDDTEKLDDYQPIQKNVESSDEESDIRNDDKQKKWEKFEDNEDHSVRNTNNLRLKDSFFTDTDESESTINPTPHPMSLFTDTPVNNNTTYSYDAVEQDVDIPRQPAVFMPPNAESQSIFSSLELLGRPTFYKSLLTVMTTKFSIFVFYTLFPVYLFEELQDLKIREMSSLMGVLSISNLMFSGISYWVNVDKKRRPICMWILCWMGSFGYFSK